LSQPLTCVSLAAIELILSALGNAHRFP
jgi:hypothetical protein